MTTDSATTPGPGVRERKRAATRARLLEVATDLFVRRGYQATSIDDIAASAGVSRMTVYHHFPRKDVIMEAWVAARRAHLQRVLADAAAGTTGTATQLRTAFAAMADLYESDAAVSRSLVAEWVRIGGPVATYAARTGGVIVRMLDRGRRRGEIRSEIDPQAAGQVLLDVYLGALYRWASGPPPAAGALRRDVLASIDVALRGVAAGTRDE